MNWADYVVLVIAVIGAITGAVMFFRKPDEDARTTEAVLDTRIKKNDLLFDLRFKNLEDNVHSILTNHLPHVETKIDGMQAQLAEIDKTVVRLTTVIEERIPKR